MYSALRSSFYALYKCVFIIIIIIIIIIYKKITLSRSKEGSNIPGTNVHCCFGTTQF